MIECELCGGTENLYVDHYEEHIEPPRRLTICKSCHQAIHNKCGHTKTQNNLIHARLPTPMLKMMNEIIPKDLHVSKSEFIRDSIIEYTKLNYPLTFERYKGEVKKK